MFLDVEKIQLLPLVTEEELGATGVQLEIVDLAVMVDRANHVVVA